MAPSEREMSPRRWLSRLQAIHYGCQDIAWYLLTPPAGEDFPAVEAGAHIDVHLPNGLVRQYSLLPQSSPRGYAIAVKRDPASRGGSRWMHDQARVGMALDISAPRNHFPLRQDNGHGAPVVLLAGGIGITPIYALMRALQAQGREFVLHYWGKSQAQMLFADEIKGDPRVVLHMASPEGGRPSVRSIVADTQPESDVYACGPRAMLDELAQMDGSKRPGQIYTERFTAAGDPAVAGQGNAQGFELVLARTGMTIAIAPQESILDVLKARGLDVMYSCEQGVCGACEVTCLEGRPLHLDSVRTPQEHDDAKTMIICCSRSKEPRLVLDI